MKIFKNQLGKDIWERKYRYEQESYEAWLDRVSGGDRELRELIAEGKFLYGGRTLANRGTGRPATMSNCYSRGFVGDSLTDIMQAAVDIASTFKAQGGQGISLSRLRPKGTPIGSEEDKFSSDGILPFMRLYNQVTESISQGGARKGALIITLDAEHKEAETFIHAKANDDQITKANISLELSDAFMKAAKADNILQEKRVYANHKVTYNVDARHLLHEAAENAYDWGEPGFIFTSPFRNYNMMQMDPDYQIETCNPCGEQPLPRDGACNLGSLNLSAFVLYPFTERAVFDEAAFARAVSVAVRALDRVVDENMGNHPLAGQRAMAEGYRNIGLGVMGFADALIKLGIRYGSKASVKWADRVGNLMFRQAVLASNALAQERGPYPKYTRALFDSRIIREHFSEKEIRSLEKAGLRNCSLLSIAPSGSIATMLNISTGAEPNFQFVYNRRTVSLNGETEKTYLVFAGIAEEYLAALAEADPEQAERIRMGGQSLPYCFVAAGEIPWRQRVDVQAALQKHIDTGISSTVNLPESATVQDIEDLIYYAWEKGCKGITVFRDNCKRLGILTKAHAKAEPDEKKPAAEPESEATGANTEGPKRGEILPPDDTCIGLKRTITTGCGTLHVEAFFRPEDGSLYETYFSKGSSGGCNSFMTGLSRMVSLAARGGVPFDAIIDQLQSTLPCVSYVTRSATHHDTSDGKCCPSAIANALLDMRAQMLAMIEKDAAAKPEERPHGKPETKEAAGQAPAGAECPVCHKRTLIHTNGCDVCWSCGYSHCG